MNDFADCPKFFNELVIDVEVVVVVILEDVVYFKCKQPVQYVAQKCANHGYGYSYYQKGIII
jgi:hypothetical protein